MNHFVIFYSTAISGAIVLYALLGILQWKSRRAQRRTPLTQNLLRSPGHTLRTGIEDLSLEISSDAVIVMILPCLGALAVSIVSLHGGGRWTYSTLALVLAGMLTFVVARLVRNLGRRNRRRLGLDAELATGEELNQLMLRGCRVFHDVPANRFNIDHVVVGPRGVYAVETKGRAKPRRGLGRDGAAVTYDGERLLFPGWEEREPLEQARRQAAWLRSWLASAVGEPVTVHAALALPGWYVDRKASGPPIVFNPKNATFLAEPAGDKELSRSLIQRIAHQIEQRCRDVAPQALRHS